MADIPSNIAKMNDAEIASDAPLTEALFNKIGANINALIDLAGLNSQEFLSNGTFLVPENIFSVFVLGYGGGSSGYKATSGSGVVPDYYQGGSAPASLVAVPVTPGTSISVVIGSGGAARSIDGANLGQPTNFGNFVEFIGGRAWVPAGLGTPLVNEPYEASVIRRFGNGTVLYQKGANSGGGQAGPGGNGGDAPGGSAAANSGAGGGGALGDTPSSGAGGSGKLIVYW
jgi:hypothetical protein